MNRSMPLILVIALITMTGVVRGKWSGRWVGAALGDAPRHRLSTIPLSVGDWNGEAVSLDERELKLARVEKSFVRRYVHRQTGDVVTVMLLGGQPGPISVHTPDVCYRGSGFEEVGDAVSYSAGSEGSPQFRVRAFQKQSPMPFLIRVFYCWTVQGDWISPEFPRLAFAGEPVLYKLYLIREVARLGDVSSDDPAIRLFEALQPHIRAVLSDTPTKKPESVE